MKKIQKAIFIIFFIISFNLYSQNTQNTNSILSDIMSSFDTKLTDEETQSGFSINVPVNGKINTEIAYLFRVV